MANGGLGAVQEILSFRILIEAVLGAISRKGTPEREKVERLSRRLHRYASDDERRTGKVYSVKRGPQMDLNRQKIREAAGADDEMVSLLEKLGSGPLPDQDTERLVGMLKSVDRALNQSRTSISAGRYL